MSIRLRLSLLFLATVLIAVAAGTTALTAMNALQSALYDHQESTAKQERAQRLEHEFVLGAIELSSYLSADATAATRERFEGSQARVRKLLTELVADAETGDERQKVKEIEQSVGTFGMAADRALFIAKKGENKKAVRDSRRFVTEEIIPILESQIAELNQLQAARELSSEQAAMRETTFASYTLAVSYVLLMTLAIAGVYFTWAWLVRPLGILGDATERISRGELDNRIPLSGSGELTQLARKIEAMAASLRTLQSELVDKERMAAVGEMTASVAHNLRNPLASIRAVVQSCHRSGAGGPDFEETAKTVMQTIDRADRWLKDMLMELRPVRIDRARLPVNSVVKEVAETIKEFAERRGVKIRLDLTTELPEISLDARRMNQALFAVVINAIEASPPGETVALRTLAATRPPYSVEIIVEDNGPGMDAETCRKIFTPTNASKKGGTGIGLSLTQRIVFGHNGSIVAQSSPGAGCRMLISLPQEQMQETPDNGAHTHIG